MSPDLLSDAERRGAERVVAADQFAWYRNTWSDSAALSWPVRHWIHALRTSTST
jgi:hypothetical protein